MALDIGEIKPLLKKGANLTLAIANTVVCSGFGFSKKGLPAGFLEDLKIVEDEDLFQPTLKNEDVKNPNIWLAEE